MRPQIPQEYSLRHELHDEVHTRPYEILNPPERLSYIALLVDEEGRRREWDHMAILCRKFGHDIPGTESKHFRIDLGEFRLKFERHQEFSRYEFVKQGKFDEPFSEPVISLIPPDWLASIPGETLVAAHFAITDCAAGTETPDIDAIASFFGGATLIGAKVGRNGAFAFSDFRIHEDGFSRFLIMANCRFPAQTGRLVLRLLEIETYRMLAMMGFPEAKRLSGRLAEADEKLNRLTDAISKGSEKNDEQLMEELSQFAVTVEDMVSSTYRRFGATRAYFTLVERRLVDLKETPIPGISTIGGFLNRRLEPARETCDSTSQWLDQLSTRVNNTSQLLRTRVDVKREEQNQELLSAMNSRFELQLHLQLTVERLSIAVFTYYSVNLIEYIAEAVNHTFHLALNSLLIEAASIPFVILLAYVIGGRVRRAIRRSGNPTL